MVEIRKYFPYFILFLLNLLLLFRFDFSPEGDAFGHLYKIERLKEDINLYWDNFWYVGYPTFLYYPPLFYYLSLLFDIKVFLFLSNLILMIITYHIAKKYTDWKFALIITIFYYLNFYRLKLLNPEGNFPQFFSTGLIPLLLINNPLINILTLSLIGYTHISTFLFSLIAFTFIYFFFHKKRDISEFLFVILSTIIITLPFYSLFYKYKDFAYFLRFQDDPYLLDLYKVPLTESLLFPIKGYWSNYIGPALLFVSFPYNVLSLLFVFLASASIKWIYTLPIIDRIPEYRWLILSMFFAFLGALKIKNKALKILFSISTFISLFFSLIFVPEKISFYYLLDALKHIDNGLYRIWIVEDYYSFIAYLPIITKKPVLNGWFREANPIFWEFSKLRKEFLQCKYDPFIEKLFVKYVIVPSKCNYANVIYKNKKYAILLIENYTFVYPKTIYKIIEFNKDIVVKLNSNGSCYIFSIGYHPLMRVYVDNKEVNFSSYKGLIKVCIPEGKHIIKFRFYNYLKDYLISILIAFLIFLHKLKDERNS